jgi:hypothetical protein
MTQRKGFLQALALSALLLFATPKAIPYSVQSHEALVDLAWKQSIRPLLLKRYPNLTEAQIQEAHAYAYGGSAIQDYGYYPFGNRFFSELTHYVRSGDFVLALLRDAKSPNELAFAIGALTHYIGDITGHSQAINHSVPIEFPKLQKKYGNTINYAEDPHAHVQTEFAFDINQLTKGRFAPSAYLDHVGLEVSMRLLRQAFFETYGLNLPDIVGTRNTAEHTYRSAVRQFIPNIARAETILHKKNFPPDVPSSDLNDLTKDLLQASADNDWEHYRRKPGFTSHLYADVIFILPKFGPLKMLAIRGPNEQTEELYVKSVNRSIHAIRFALDHYDTLNIYMANRDLDTGDTIRPGSYLLCDKTYARLLSELTSHPETPIPAQVKHDIAAYYVDSEAPIATKRDPQKWQTLQANLKTLEGMKTSGELNSIQFEPFGDE